MGAAAIFILLLACAVGSAAQMQMPMPKPGQKSGSSLGPAPTFRQNILRHMESGTNAGPDSAAPPMLMRMSGKWMQMLHGEVIAADQQQSGPRGADKVFS